MGGGNVRAGDSATDGVISIYGMPGGRERRGSI